MWKCDNVKNVKMLSPLFSSFFYSLQKVSKYQEKKKD